MEIKVNIEATGLEGAINSLAQALSGQQVTGQSNQQQVQEQQQIPVQQPQTQSVPVQNTQQVQQPPAQQGQQQPVQQNQQQPAQQQGAVPTSAPEYDMNQLGVAATQLMDAGRQNDVLGLLNNTFGVQSLMELPQEHYGAFATKLRELGAKI